MSRRLTSLVLLLALAACGRSADAIRGEAQTALDAGDSAKAQQLAEEGLKSAGDDKAMAWRLQQIRLEAMAKAKMGSAVAKELDTLSASYGPQCNASLYRSLADKTKAAGDSTGALDILAAGDKKFPTDPSFKTSIDEIKNSSVDPAEVEKLKALGYL